MNADQTSKVDTLTADLRRRLEEAEEVIRAIREGEIDALVVRNQTREEEIFTLEGGVESYRSFMEAMDIGAAAFDRSSNLVYANKVLCDLVGLSRDDLSAAKLFQALGPNGSEAVKSLIEKPSVSSVREVKLGSGDGLRHLQIAAGEMSLGTSRGFAMTFTDITVRIQSEQRREAERTVLAILASALEAVIVCDLKGVVTHANAAAFALAGGDPIGSPFDQAFSLDFRGATGLMQGEDFLDVVAGGQAIQGIEAVAPRSRGGKDVLVSASPLVVGEGSIAGTVVTLVDLSRRKAAEKQQLLLMGELDHRVKNTLALVVSISNRTASTEDTIEGFRTAFSGRIHALAATHNVLADRAWSSIQLSEIVATELAPYVNDLGSKLKVVGDDVEILPRAAIAFGLVIHELATNAVKHGALSSDQGRIEISVQKQDDYVEVVWKERGGPRVVAPTRKGFGDTVIKRSLQYSPKGGATLDFHEDGVRCEIRVPSEDVFVA